MQKLFKILLASQLIINLTMNLNGMDDQQEISLISSITLGNLTILMGTVAKNKIEDSKCRVVYDAATDKYAGSLYDEKYSHADWGELELSPEEAQNYFHQLANTEAILCLP